MMVKTLLNIQNIFIKALQVLILSICLITVSFGQSSKKVDLQNKYKKLQEDIKKIETLIANTVTEKSNSLEQLKSINSKIYTRESLINNINAQVVFIQENIADKQAVILALEDDIIRLKEDYASMVLNAYRNKYNTTNAIGFLFSSDSFSKRASSSFMRDKLNSIPERGVKRSCAEQAIN